MMIRTHNDRQREEETEGRRIVVGHLHCPESNTWSIAYVLLTNENYICPFTSKDGYMLCLFALVFLCDPQAVLNQL